jgi:Tfp pilus assembly protein FimT
MFKMKRFNGFSAVEMGICFLVVIVIISVLVFVFNPGKALAEKRNSQRRGDIQKIVDDVSKYAAEHGGVLPKGIPISKECKGSEFELCKMEAKDCNGLVKVDGLATLPVDPKSDNKNGAGYNLVQNETGRITVCAPKSELNESISLSK